MKAKAFERGFTLVELMISIALVVILMLGITKVFSLTSATVGANNQVSSAMRDARGAQSVMYNDLANAVGDDAPCMILRSVEMPAFRNKQDRDGDRDFDSTANPATQWKQMLTVDLNGNNLEGEARNVSPGEQISPTTYNYRNHRLDIFSFFSRQRLPRQTGGLASNTSTPFIAQMSAQEAWVWYGHLWLPDNKGNWAVPTSNTPSATFPGMGDPVQTNPNNYYASDWILGRVAMLLQLPDSTTGQIVDKPGVTGKPQQFIATDTTKFPLSPLQAGSYDAGKVGSGAGTFVLENSRYDLAGTNIDTFRNQLSAYIALPSTKQWWSKMMCGGINNPDNSDPDVIVANGVPTGCRFQATPFVSQPITAANLSKQFPIFLRGCTQFMVEYAGDFLNQDTNALLPSGLPNPTYGQVLNAYWNLDPAVPSTDGQVDFIVVWNDANGNGTIDPGEQSRQIRWYGMPRDTDGSGTIPRWKTGSSLTGNNLVDVVPARDVMFTAMNTTASKAAGASDNVSTTIKTNLATLVASNPNAGMPFEYDLPAPTGGTDYVTDMPVHSNYTCAWGPKDPKPKMIRIIFTLDDPGGKLPDGQTFEYVFALP